MAVTKTHPIKSTLKAAIDYILNPEKTDGKLLASSFGCGLETADIEFAWTREAAGDRGTHLGRHLIQSFAVGETTPEEAHKIGMELAGAVLGGKYEFVLTTHVDKDHLHNHLIFNAVSFVDYKKYHSNKQSYHFIRRTSDRICKEHGLSVVVPGQDKGKSYAEYTAEKQGTSYKAKLKTAIDTLIPQVKDFDELLRRLQEMGYEIKQGKYISFRAAGQERFTRTKTLGAAYTEEAIKERIKGVYVAKTKTLREDKKIRLVVDLENSIKAQQSAGYERWAKIHNLKQAAKSMNFLTENKIEYYSELESKIADIMTAHDAAAKAVKEVEQRMSDLSLLIKHTTTYHNRKLFAHVFTLLFLPGIFGDSCRLLLLRGFFALYGVVRHEHTVYFEIVGVLLRDRRGDFRKQAVIRFDTPIQILFHSCLVGENLSILSGNLRLGSAWAVGAHAPCKRP